MYEYFKTRQDILEKVNDLSKIIDLLLKDVIKLDNTDKGTLDAICYFYNKKETLISILTSEIITLCNTLDTKDNVILKYVRCYVDNEIDFLEGENNEK